MQKCSFAEVSAGPFGAEGNEALARQTIFRAAHGQTKAEADSRSLINPSARWSKTKNLPFVTGKRAFL